MPCYHHGPPAPLPCSPRKEQIFPGPGSCWVMTFLASKPESVQSTSSVPGSQIQGWCFGYWFKCVNFLTLTRSPFEVNTLLRKIHTSSKATVFGVEWRGVECVDPHWSSSLRGQKALRCAGNFVSEDRIYEEPVYSLVNKYWFKVALNGFVMKRWGHKSSFFL